MMHNTVSNTLIRITDLILLAKSKTFLLTVCCLSPLPWLESSPRHVRKLPVTYGKGLILIGQYVVSFTDLVLLTK